MNKTIIRSGVNLGLLLCLAGCGHSPERSPNSDLPPKINSPTTSSSPSRTAPTNPEPNLNGFFDWPVDSARLSRGFTPYPTGRAHRPHFGIDLAGPKGSNIYSAQEGRVIYVGSGFHGFGKMIMIEGNSGFATLYAHLSKYKIKQGQRVHVGSLIGAMGRTGHATGVHLHFEIRKDRSPVDPLGYLPTVKFAQDEEIPLPPMQVQPIESQIGPQMADSVDIAD